MISQFQTSKRRIQLFTQLHISLIGESSDEQAWQTMTAADQDAINRVFANFAKAVAAYEMKLAANNAPFDTFVEGLRTGNAEQQQAISQPAIDGLKIFVGKGNCVLCHSGAQMTTPNSTTSASTPATGSPTKTKAAPPQSHKSSTTPPTTRPPPTRPLPIDISLLS